jgi:hypothetical protein
LSQFKLGSQYGGSVGDVETHQRCVFSTTNLRVLTIASAQADQSFGKTLPNRFVISA